MAPFAPSVLRLSSANNVAQCNKLSTSCYQVSGHAKCYKSGSSSWSSRSGRGKRRMAAMPDS